MDFNPAVHECSQENRLLRNFYPWIKICIWMHTHPLKPMIIREWAHNNPWIWWTDCFKVEDYCVLIHGWPWASMDEYASICRFLSMDKNPAIGGFSANIHVWLDENPSNEHAAWCSSPKSRIVVCSFNPPTFTYCRMKIQFFPTVNTFQAGFKSSLLFTVNPV